MRSVAICLLGVLSASSARADGTVIARPTDERGGVWVGCGQIYAVGWVVFERVRVVDGDDPGKRFVGILSCPGDSPHAGDERLVLSHKKPGSMPDVSDKLPDLPRFFVTSERPESAPETHLAGRLLDKTQKDVEAKWPATGSDAPWTILTPYLRVRYSNGVVVGVRVQIAEALTCETGQEWVGFEIGSGGRGMPIPRKDRCVWPSTSEHSRLGKGLSGVMTYADHWFEVDRE